MLFSWCLKMFEEQIFSTLDSDLQSFLKLIM